MSRRSRYPASWVVPCTGMPPGGLSSVGPRTPPPPPPQQGGQCGGPYAPVLRDAQVASRREPGRDSRTARARRGAGVAVVACPAAAAHALAQAFARGTRRRPMLQAERALCAIAPRGRLSCGVASGTLLGGACGGLLAYGSRDGPPSKGTWEIVHKEAVSQRRPHAGRRSHAPNPRVPAVHRLAHEQQHHLVACREERAGRNPAHTRPAGGRCERQCPNGAPLSSVPAAPWGSGRPTALRRIWARSPGGRSVPRSRWSGEAWSARPTNAS